MFLFTIADYFTGDLLYFFLGLSLQIWVLTDYHWLIKITQIDIEKLFCQIDQEEKTVTNDFYISHSTIHIHIS